jgi:hypothetical protein
MRIVRGFCGIEMTYDDVRCENLFRDRAIESIRSALHKSASRNPTKFATGLLRHTRRPAGS